jgi:hypothetical protein
MSAFCHEGILISVTAVTVLRDPHHQSVESNPLMSFSNALRPIPHHTIL